MVRIKSRPKYGHLYSAFKYQVHFLKRSDIIAKQLIYLQTSHTCLYSSAAEHYSPLAGTHFTVPVQSVEG